MASWTDLVNAGAQGILDLARKYIAGETDNISLAPPRLEKIELDFDPKVIKPKYALETDDAALARHSHALEATLSTYPDLRAFFYNMYTRSKVLFDTTLAPREDFLPMMRNLTNLFLFMLERNVDFWDATDDRMKACMRVLEDARAFWSEHRDTDLRSTLASAIMFIKQHKKIIDAENKPAAAPKPLPRNIKLAGTRRTRRRR